MTQNHVNIEKHLYLKLKDTLRELIYSFKIEGQDIMGLSRIGAKALARWMTGKGHPLDAVKRDITQDDEAWYADVRVLDKGTGLALLGSSKCRKMKTLEARGEKPNEHARTIALNKAQRNAILAHVPDKMIARFIKQAIEKGKVRKVPQEEVKTAVPEAVGAGRALVRRSSIRPASSKPWRRPASMRRSSPSIQRMAGTWLGR